MSTQFNDKALAWLTQNTGIGVQYLDIKKLKGSTSSSVFRIQHRGDGAQQFVLRVPENAEWLAEEPDLAEHEAAALAEAHKAGLHAPKPIAFATHDVGFGMPVVLMSFMEGHIELRPASLAHWLSKLASELAAIHQHTAIGFPWQFRSWVKRDALTVPQWSGIPRLWERAIEIHRGAVPASPQVFIHRDYHPTNVLWQHGHVSGVVDWINACQGPAGVDVAHCRSNLALMLGVKAAEQFLKRYCEVAEGFEYHPYWDVDSVLDMWVDGPGFYGPWQEFGLDVIAANVIQQRADAYLASVMARL